MNPCVLQCNPPSKPKYNDCHVVYFGFEGGGRILLDVLVALRSQPLYLMYTFREQGFDELTYCEQGFSELTYCELSAHHHTCSELHGIVKHFSRPKPRVRKMVKVE